MAQRRTFHIGSGLHATQWFRHTFFFILWPHHPLEPHHLPQIIKGKTKPGGHIATSPASTGIDTCSFLSHLHPLSNNSQYLNEFKKKKQGLETKHIHLELTKSVFKWILWPKAISAKFSKSYALYNNTFQKTSENAVSETWQSLWQTRSASFSTVWEHGYLKQYPVFQPGCTVHLPL